MRVRVSIFLWTCIICALDPLCVSSNSQSGFCHWDAGGFRADRVYGSATEDTWLHWRNRSGGGIVLEAVCIVVDSMPGTPHAYFYSAAWCVPSVLLVASAYVLNFFHQSPSFPFVWAISRFLQIRPLVYLGNISMPLFLVHQLVIRYLGATYDLALYPLLSLFLCFGVSIMIASVVQNASLRHTKVNHI